MTTPDPSTLTPGELLTVDEHRAVDLLGEVYQLIVKIAGDGPTRDADLAEAASRVHVLQRMVMSQAARRAYPDLYRPLGGVLPDRPVA